MTKAEARAEFSRLSAQAENKLELDRAALLLAAEEYPHLDVESYLAQLDAFAAQARAQDDPQAAPITRILRFNDYFFNTLGFRGNTENYFDARNSFLNDVIDRRTGIPITLSVVYLETARRFGLTLHGVGLPGHFIVKYSDEDGEILIDPFHGGRLLTEDDCARMLAEVYRGALPFQPELLQAVTKKQILTRMLQNLKGIYASAGDQHKLLGAIERALLLNPSAPQEIRDRGLAYAMLRRYPQAIADLETYLRRAPHASEADTIKKQIAQLRQQQAQLN